MRLFTHLWLQLVADFHTEEIKKNFVQEILWCPKNVGPKKHVIVHKELIWSEKNVAQKYCRHVLKWPNQLILISFLGWGLR